MIIKIHGSHTGERFFLVIDEDYREVQKKYNDEPQKWFEWVIENGVLIPGDEYMLVSKEEAEAMAREFSWTYISKENPVCNQAINRLFEFTRRVRDAR